jgi:hypothetical protein
MVMHQVRKYIVQGFGIAAIAACAHVLTGVYTSFDQIELNTGFEKTHPAEFNVLQKDNLRNSLELLLQSGGAKNFLLAELDHCDLRLPNFLADPATIDLFARYNVNIFLEIPAKKDDVSPSIDFGTLHVTCGAKSNSSILSSLSDRAKDKIGVYASDFEGDVGLGGALIFLNAAASIPEARFLRKIGLETLGDYWRHEIGLVPFLNMRLNEAFAASFVEQHTPPDGRSLTIRGGAHLLLEGSRTLRALLSDSICISFGDTYRNEDGAVRKLADDGKDFYMKFVTPDYFVDLQTGALMPYPLSPQPSITNGANSAAQPQ